MPRKILIVDDEEVNRRILKRILSAEYDVLEAENGEAAMICLQRSYKSLAAVLLDLSMPVMDGFEVLRRMRGNVAYSQIPIVVETGETNQNIEMLALNLGAQDFITKPYNPGILLARLNNLIKLRETAATVNALQRDRLTGLLSRENFFQTAAERIKSKPAGYYVLSAVDVDGFKLVNDQYGTEKGDEVLKRLAKTVDKDCQDNGGVCGRIAGDKFIVLFPREALDDEKNASLKRQASVFRGIAVPLTISTGRYIVDDKSLSVSAMYDRAVIAQSTVKGRYDVHTAVFDDIMREQFLWERTVTGEMKSALQEGQFAVWFQPQYNHSTGALIGAEALVRWQHPTMGSIPPMKFIPVFERNGFVYEVDKFVWRNTCALLRKWIDMGRTPLPVSVNVSRYDILRADLIEVLTGYLEEYELPPGLLRLEVTESAFADDAGRIVTVVKALIDRGFTVEIDDFGSGYSSLNTLKDVPAQVVKLDMRFLEGGEDSGRGGNIVESVVRMIKWLGMSVLAEGVETENQANYLKSIGCNYIQGFLYARPMPADAYEALCSGVTKEEKILEIKTVENLDNNAFWNPDSMDTLIFSSYVGAACIFEDNGGDIEILRVSDGYVAMLGSSVMTGDDVLKLDVNAHLTPEDVRSVRDAVQRSMETGDEVPGECVFLNLPGCPEKTYINVTFRTIAKTGERRLVYCINENITAQRQAEERRQVAEAREHKLAEQLTAIMENVDGGISAVTIIDGAVKYLFANERYYSILGYTKEQFDNEVKDAFHLVYQEDRARIQAIATDVLRKQRKDSYEYRCVRRNKSLVYLRCNASFMYFEGLSDPVLLSVITDITESVQARQKEKDTAAQMQVIMRNMGGGIAAVSRHHGRPHYIFINDQYAEMLGYTKEQFKSELPGGILDIVVPEDKPIVEGDIQENEDAGREITAEFRVIRRDGRTIWLRSTTSVRQMYGIAAPVHISVIYDITGERETMEHINALNANLTALMNDTPGGFARMRFTRDGKLVTEYVNEPFCRLRGMTAREILSADNEDAMHTVHPDDLPEVQAAMEQMLATGESGRMMYRLRRKDGTYIPLNVFARGTKNEAGDTILNAYYAELDTEEKKELSARETVPFALASIMAASTELSFVKDKNFTYLYCSRPFALMVGLENERDIAGKTDYDLFDRATADKYRRDDEMLFSAGQSLIDYIEAIPSDDGVPHYSSTSKYILRDSTGEMIGLYGCGRDVTDTRTAFERLKLLTDNIPGGIASYINTPDGYRLSYFSDGYCKLLGYTRAEYEAISDHDITSRVFAEDIPAIKRAVEQLLTNNTPLDCTYRVHTRDGDYKWVNIRGGVTEQSGDTAYVNTVLLDVTKTRLAQEAVRIHEEEVKLALSKMSRIIAEYDIEKRTLTLPDIYSAKFGFPAVAENVPYGMQKTGGMTDEMFDRYVAFYEAVIRGEDPAPIEVVKRTPDGTARWERMTAYTVFGADGKPVKALIAADNITEQRRQYELEQNRPTLGEENLLVHALFNLNTGETLDYAYRDGTVVPEKERTAFLFGKDSLNEIIIDPAEREKYRALNNPAKLLTLFEQGETELSMDYRRKLRDGRTRWVRNLLHLIREPEGEDVLLFEYCYDVEQEKLSELAFRSVINVGYDFVARIDGGTGRVTYDTNQNLTEGLPAARAGDMDSITEIGVERDVYPEDRDAVRKNLSLEGIKENLADRDLFQFTHRILLSDGEVRYKRLTAYYLDRELDVLILLREDISQIMEEENRKNAALGDALAAANQASLAKTAFLSRMSRELRTPINDIISLSAPDQQDGNAPTGDSIGRIGVSARQLLALVNDILEMSRIESGRVTLEEAPFSMEALLDRVNAAIGAQAEEKGVFYDASVTGVLSPLYRGDSAKLQEILMSVLSNAVKFTPAGGTVSFRTERTGGEKQQDSLRFTVGDTGVGIDEAFLPRLFEPFAQEKDGVTAAYRGTGLGLAITKNLLDMMGGRISVRSAKGAGSVFTVELPMTVEETP